MLKRNVTVTSFKPSSSIGNVEQGGIFYDVFSKRSEIELTTAIIVPKDEENRKAQSYRQVSSPFYFWVY